MNYLIYLAYGSAEIRSEAFYSLLSYDKITISRSATILIYTDNVPAFQQLFGQRPDVIYPVVAPAQWQAWRGSVNKVYLLKIGVLAHAARHYPGNLLFLDTDTIWLQDPAPVFEHLALGQRYMHLDEGALRQGNELSRKVYRHLKHHSWQVGEHSITLQPDTRLFNSGVIGFRSVDAYTLTDVLTLAEQLYATYNKHMMEQLAFSLRFALDGPIQEAAPYLLHYWNLKDARPALARVFTHVTQTSPAELYARASQLDLPQLHYAELAYRNLSGWRRTLLKLIGRKWRMPEL